MTLTDIQVFNLMGIAVSAQRNALIADFLSGGMDALRHLSDDDVKEACLGYAKRSDGSFPIILSTLQKQRMRALVLWVKYQTRIQQPATFEQGTSSTTLKAKLDEAWEREELRKEQRKVGQSYLDHSFNSKLKSQAQYEKFAEELNSTLTMIIGCQGIPLTYVIREEEKPSIDKDLPFHKIVILAATLKGPKFEIDARTVHQIILQNVHEDSDAYTYVKPLLRHHDGRMFILTQD